MLVVLWQLAPGPRGGGGTQIWFRRGCAAEAAKPVPIFKGHFGGKGYPLLGVLNQENDVFVYTLATKWAKISSIYSKITKVGGMFKDFPAQNHTLCLRIFLKKRPIRAAHPRMPYTASTPPPPPRALDNSHLTLTLPLLLTLTLSIPIPPALTLKSNWVVIVHEVIILIQILVNRCYYIIINLIPAFQYNKWFFFFFFF